VVAAAGLHGLERRDANAGYHRTEPHPAIAYAVDRFRGLTHRKRGLLMEAKGASVALHYRKRPDLEAELVAEARALGRETGLEFRPSAMVVELRTPGPHKGDAVCAFMAEPPFRRARPIYLGDDLTDEDGFQAALRLGGFGVLVGPDRPTQAVYRLADVEAVLVWLETLVGLETSPVWLETRGAGRAKAGRVNEDRLDG
jgi:trehalose 6-phosphate phosphatase